MDEIKYINQSTNRDKHSNDEENVFFCCHTSNKCDNTETEVTSHSSVFTVLTGDEWQCPLMITAPHLMVSFLTTILIILTCDNNNASY